jgi:hypothetical protein
MITVEKAQEVGIKPEDEKSPLDVLGNNAMTTKEIAAELNKLLPSEYKKISYSCAKQKMVRLESKGYVSRIKISGLIHWLITQPSQ